MDFLVQRSTSLNKFIDIQGHITLFSQTEDTSEEIQLQLKGRACRALLKVDTPELHFDDCRPRGTYVKDFTLWNCSEMPISFQISEKNGENTLFQFLDNETGIPLLGNYFK